MQLENVEAANALLSMSPQFAHDLQPGDIDSVLASTSTVQDSGRIDLERIMLECNLEIYSAKYHTEPEQDQASGQSGRQQEAAGQEATSQKADGPQPAGNNNKKKKNRKKGLPKAVQVEQVTARGIMEGPPAPKGPLAAEAPLPTPSQAEPRHDSPLSAAVAALASDAEPEHRLGPAEQNIQPQLEVDMSADDQPHGTPEKLEVPEQAQGGIVTMPKMYLGPGFSTTGLEQLQRLQVSVSPESEEELFHDAGSGFESAAQLTSAGSRRASLDSDLAWPQYSSTGKWSHSLQSLAEPAAHHYSVLSCLTSGIPKSYITSDSAWCTALAAPSQQVWWDISLVWLGQL